MGGGGADAAAAAAVLVPVLTDEVGTSEDGMDEAAVSVGSDDCAGSTGAVIGAA